MPWENHFPPILLWYTLDQCQQRQLASNLHALRRKTMPWFAANNRARREKDGSAERISVGGWRLAKADPECLGLRMENVVQICETRHSSVAFLTQESFFA